MTTRLPTRPRLHDPVDDATRREFLAMVTAAGLLAACGDESSSVETGGDDTATRTITDDEGRAVEIPARPQRVAVLNAEVAAHIVTLGDTPAGVAVSGDDPAAIFESFNGDEVDLGAIENLGSDRPGELNVERIVELGPDLILAASYLIDDRADLEAVAPTLFVDPRTNVDGEPFQKARFLADIVGIEDRLDARVEEYRSALDAFRETHADELDGLDFVYWDTGFDGTVYAYDVDVFAMNAVMADLGVPMAASVVADASPDNGYLETSVERMGDYEAALIFLGRYDGEPTEGAVATVLSSTFAATNDQILDSRNANRLTFHLLQSQIDVLAELDKFFATRDLRPLP